MSTKVKSTKYINFLSYILRLFCMRSNLNSVQLFGLAVAMACFTGVIAQIKIYLPWTPVPITGQTLGVILSGALLGACWGGISQLIYATAGIAGIPWFANWRSGINILVGPSGGYILGFVLCATVIGYTIDKYIKTKKFYFILLVIAFCNFVFIYGLGITQLYLWIIVTTHIPPTVWQLVYMGVIPFILGDAIKIVMASLIVTKLLPKE